MYKINKIIDEGDKDEFVGQILDIFEDFLTKKKVLMNGKVASPEEAVIHGNDYSNLENRLNQMMKLWKVFEEDQK